MQQLLKTHNRQCRTRAFILAAFVVCSFMVFGAHFHSNITATSTLNQTSTHKSWFSARSNGCFREWPKVQLFLPMPPSGKNFRLSLDVFLPSFAFFWPSRQSKTTVLVITDGDDIAASDSAVSRIGKLSKQIQIEHLLQVKLNQSPKLTFHRGGWDRQQWLMFWADNFTSPDVDFVGFVDSDTAFSTRVMLSDLFTDAGVPIIRPTFGKLANAPWPAQTEWVTGRKEPFLCMSYFPVILRLEHLPKIRQYITRQMRMPTFDQAFELLSKNESEYSQYNIMCAYLWWHERNSYSWQVAINNEPHSNGRFGPGQITALEEGEITAEYLKQSPRVCFHGDLHDDLCTSDEGGLIRAAKFGLCFSMPSSLRKSCNACMEIVPDRQNALNPCEWRFETRSYGTTYPKALDAHRHRLKLMNRCPFDMLWESDKAGFAMWKKKQLFTNSECALLSKDQTV